MKNSSSFRPEPVALSLQVMYRMGGLRNALVYLLDITRPMMPVTRINTIFAYSDASTVISVADTSTVSVSNKYSSGGRSRPLLPSTAPSAGAPKSTSVIPAGSRQTVSSALYSPLAG